MPVKFSDLKRSYFTNTYVLQGTKVLFPISAIFARFNIKNTATYYFKVTRKTKKLTENNKLKTNQSKIIAMQNNCISVRKVLILVWLKMDQI